MEKESFVFKKGYDAVWLKDAFQLFNESGLKRNSIEQVGQALKNSTQIITCWQERTLIGIGRMLTDGAMYASIFDVAVSPQHQKKGIGKTIMEKLIAEAPETCIHLTSTFGNETFYKNLGFKPHKTAMALYPEKLKTSPYLGE